MLEFISIVTSIAGLFTLLDLFIEKQAKSKISEYVFGFGEADLNGFEHNVIQALLSRLRVDGRISFKRVLFRYTLVIGLILNLIWNIIEFGFQYEWAVDETVSLPLRILAAFASIPISIAVFWPFDCWSLWVTNKVFGLNRSGSFLRFLGRTFLDVIITMLPFFFVLLIGVVLLFKFPLLDENSLSFMVFAVAITVMGLNAFGSLLITFVQLLTLGVGMLLRSLLRLTRLNQGLAMVSRAHEFPFTFIGLIVGLTSACIVTIV